jgi:hypothetical protein
MSSTDEVYQDGYAIAPNVVGVSTLSALMRPLLLHASSPARQPGHRRVIHLEYASEALPGGLQWYETPPGQVGAGQSVDFG